MPIIANEILKLVDVQSYDGQQILNVYHFRANTNISPSSGNAAQKWWDFVKATLRPLQISQLTHQYVTLESLDGDKTFYHYDIPSGERVGTYATSGDAEAAFVAYPFRLTTNSRLVRPGSKRICGVSEGATDPLGVLSAGVLALMNALGAIMIQTVPILPLNVESMDPVIVGFPHPATAHRPARLAREITLITGYNLPPVVTTQNTRKRGRGS